jgi:predicted nucleic acid-binding protein
MSEADSFFDTNVLLYLLSAEAAKADRAEALLAVGGIVGVIRSCAAVARICATIRASSAFDFGGTSGGSCVRQGSANGALSS